MTSPGLIGYARVSTDGQSVQRRMDGLRKVGCAEIREKSVSGAAQAAPCWPPFCAGSAAAGAGRRRA
jgi:hypothetical protein